MSQPLLIGESTSSKLLIIRQKKTNASHRGINAGSKYDIEGFCAALSPTRTALNDPIDKVFQIEQAVEYVWQGKQIDKTVLRL